MDELTEANDMALKPETWVDRYGDYLFRYAVSRLRDGEAAEEVVKKHLSRLFGMSNSIRQRGLSERGCWAFSNVKSSTWSALAIEQLP